MSSSPDSTVPDVEQPLLDRFQRPLRDLRISVTDRCNFRCQYCMPREVFGPGFEFLPRDQILSFEEIARLAAVFASLGVRKFRLTGGEPLLRNDLPKLVEMLAAIDGVPRARRGARFRAVVALVLPGGRQFVREGVIEGRIALEPRGESGFGYDPVFELPDGRTMAEIGREKQDVSHRAQALRAMMEVLNTVARGGGDA